MPKGRAQVLIKYLALVAGFSFDARVSSGQILLKNSIKLEVCFSANNQTIMNFLQQLVCGLTSGSVGRDR